MEKREEQTFLDRILDYANEYEASDIHISVDNYIAIRVVSGMEQNTDFGKLTKSETRKIKDDLFSLISSDVLSFAENELKKNGHCAFSFKNEFLQAKYRVNLSKYNSGYYIVMRKNSVNPLNLEDLGFYKNTLSALKTIQKKKSGLFLVVGATGSGKSTTLAAVIKGINENQNKNIITLEDPIEYEHESSESVVVQKELGRDLESFEEGLRSALREDPDIILVGEIRDINTLDLALKASETGHLVLSTLHTDNAVSTIQRILSMSPAGTEQFVRERLSEALLGVIAQKLVKTDNKRIVLWDILMSNVAVKNSIKSNDISQIKSTLDNIPMSQSYNKTLKEHFNNGNLTEEECYKNTSDLSSLKKMLES